MRCETCPVRGAACLGESVPRLCVLARTRGDYRRQLTRLAEEALAGGAEPRRLDLREVLAVVSGCPERGPVLPPTLQPECGCSELTECRAGRGEYPGRVTLQDCLSCVAGRWGA